MQNQRQKLSLEVRQKLALELASSISQTISTHWDIKILSGIVPAEIKSNDALYDKKRHMLEGARLAKFEADIVEELFLGRWKAPDQASEPCPLHYFGIGTGLALSLVASLAGRHMHRIIAYEVSNTGFENGEEAFARQDVDLGNEVLMADIYFACQSKYILPAPGVKLIAPRVLDILDKQEDDWESKPPGERKTARTARRMGQLLPSSLEILLIQRCPQDNPDARWLDSTPHSLQEIQRYMSEGAQKCVQMTELGQTTYHGQLHRAILVHL